MFGERCMGYTSCGHTTNWRSECTCGEVEYASARKPKAVEKPVSFTFAQLEPYLHHDVGCEANDLDLLDHSPCTCGLRAFYNPWNRKPTP